jgi:hypothetical protein
LRPEAVLEFGEEEGTGDKRDLVGEAERARQARMCRRFSSGFVGMAARAGTIRFHNLMIARMF